MHACFNSAMIPFPSFYDVYLFKVNLEVPVYHRIQILETVCSQIESKI
jgi:hypothetical protein